MAESLVHSYDLTAFRLTRILSSNSRAKTICVLGKFVDGRGDASDRPAIVLLEKTAFTDANVSTIPTANDDDATLAAAVETNNDTDTQPNSKTFFCSQTELKQEFVNDIYGQFQCFPHPDINSNSIFIRNFTHSIRSSVVYVPV